jgi:hypothetical protein
LIERKIKKLSDDLLEEFENYDKLMKEQEELFMKVQSEKRFDLK